MSYSDLTRMRGYQDSSPSKGNQVTCPIVFWWVGANETLWFWKTNTLYISSLILHNTTLIIVECVIYWKIFFAYFLAVAHIRSMACISEICDVTLKYLHINSDLVSVNGPISPVEIWLDNNTTYYCSLWKTVKSGLIFHNAIQKTSNISRIATFGLFPDQFFKWSSIIRHT